MNRYSLLVLVFFLFALLSVSFVFSVKWSSIHGEFNVTQNETFLNWTDNYKNNIIIGINASLGYNIDVKVNNDTTDITGNYSQKSFYYPSTKYVNVCFFEDRNVPISVNNTTGIGNIEYNKAPGTSFNFIFIHTANCPPGKYYGTVMIRNNTNAAENLNVTVTIDVPITVDNELNLTTGVGSFKGRINANSSTYHSFYFNTSDNKTVENSTSITLRLGPIDRKSVV